MGGHGGRARAPDVVEGRGLDAGLGEPAAHPNSRYITPIGAVPDPRPRVGRPEGRADLGDPVRRPAQDHRAAGDAGPRLAARHVHGRHHVEREDRGGRGRARPGAPRPDGDAAVPRLQRGRLLPALGGRRQGRRRRRSCRRSSTSTGSAAATTAGSCGPASARTAACSSGAIERIEGRGAAAETPVGHVPTADQMDLDGLDADRRRRRPPRSPSTSTSGGRRSRSSRSGSPGSGTSCRPRCATSWRR